jgi:hypothetical protein
MNRMNVEKTIVNIAFLENLYALPDERPLPRAEPDVTARLQRRM